MLTKRITSGQMKANSSKLMLTNLCLRLLKALSKNHTMPKAIAKLRPLWKSQKPYKLMSRLL